MVPLNVRSHFFASGKLLNSCSNFTPIPDKISSFYDSRCIKSEGHCSLNRMLSLKSPSVYSPISTLLITFLQSHWKLICVSFTVHMSISARHRQWHCRDTKNECHLGMVAPRRIIVLAELQRHCLRHCLKQNNASIEEKRRRSVKMTMATFTCV